MKPSLEIRKYFKWARWQQQTSEGIQITVQSTRSHKLQISHSFLWIYTVDSWTLHTECCFHPILLHLIEQTYVNGNSSAATVIQQWNNCNVMTVLVARTVYTANKHTLRSRHDCATQTSTTITNRNINNKQMWYFPSNIFSTDDYTRSLFIETPTTATINFVMYEDTDRNCNWPTSIINLTLTLALILLTLFTLSIFPTYPYKP